MRLARHNPPPRHNPSAAAALNEIDLSNNHDRFYVYVMASKRGGHLAVSMAQDIASRVDNQKNDLHPRDFTSVHGIHTLVHVVEFDDLCEALDCYGVLRGMDPDLLSRLIDKENPTWSDLYEAYAG